MTTNTQGIGGDSLSNEEAYTVVPPLDNPVPVPTINTQANIVESEFIKNPVINLDGIDDHWRLNNLYEKLGKDWFIEFKLGTLQQESLPYTLLIDRPPNQETPEGKIRAYIYITDSKQLLTNFCFYSDLWLNDKPARSSLYFPKEGREVKLKFQLANDTFWFDNLGMRYNEVGFVDTYLADLKIYDPEGVLRYSFSLRRQDMIGNQQVCPISGHVIDFVNGDGSPDMAQQEPSRTGKSYLFSGVDEYIPIRPRTFNGDFEFTVEYRKSVALDTNVALIGGMNTSSNSGAFAVYLRSDNEYIQAQVPVEGGGFQYIAVPCQDVGQDGLVTIKRENGVVRISNGNVTGTVKYVGNSEVEVGCIGGWRRTLMPMQGYIHKVDLGGGDIYDLTKNPDKNFIEHDNRRDGVEILKHSGRIFFETDRAWSQIIIGDPQVPYVTNVKDNLFRLRARNYADANVRYILNDAPVVIDAGESLETIVAPRNNTPNRNYVSSTGSGVKGFGYFTVNETWAVPIINYNQGNWRDL